MVELSEWIDWARGSAGRLPSYGALLKLLTELQAARRAVAELYPMEWSAYRGLLRVTKELRAAREELAELRAQHQRQLHEALEQQAAVWVRAAELTPAVLLEQLLAMVGPGWDLVADSDSERGRRPQYHAGWFRGGATTGRKLEEHHGEGADCAAAIRAATIALLRGRQKCGTCAHWGSPDDEGGDRECLATELRLRKTAESSCGESWRLAQWLEPEPRQLPVSPARLVRAALAWADETAGYGSVALTDAEVELLAAANELRGLEPESGDGEDGK